MVFGKKGCVKCKALNQRLDSLLATPEYSDFEKKYWDVMTEEGLVEFCKIECVNPQRIPAFVVLKRASDGKYLPLENPAPETADEVCRASKLYTLLGLQTDYSDVGQGVLSPAMITKVLAEARAV